MAAINWNRMMVLLICVGFSCVVAALIRGDAGGGAIRAIDFGAVYYGARSVLRHEDPYDASMALREFEAEGGKFPTATPKEEEAARTTITVVIYPPTALLVLAPLAMLSWTVAQIVWSGLIACLLVAAAVLMWNLAADASVFAGCMLAFMLLNCFLLLVVGNPAGVVVPLCAIAAWCFVKRRYELAGVVMLAFSLVIKPHDAGFVWLYFLLAGDTGRKRAFQTLALTAILGISAIIWIAPASPQWIGEIRSNLARQSTRGGIADPGPTGTPSRAFGGLINLQSAVSVFRNDPRFYNPVTYLVLGCLILLWCVAVLRKRNSREGALLALAAISVLTLLPVYHWAHDAKLLLLTIPACAMLWADGGARRWMALGLTSAAIFVTSDIPLIIWTVATSKVAASTSTLGGKLTLLALQPQPLVLLAAGCFYLWVYIRHEPAGGEVEAPGETAARAMA